MPTGLDMTDTQAPIRFVSGRYAVDLTWTVAHGVSVHVEDPGPLSSADLRDYTAFLEYYVPEEMATLEIRQQRNHLDPAEFGLVPVSGDCATPRQDDMIWVRADAPLDFGTLFLRHQPGTQSLGGRAIGNWILVMNGATNEQLSRVEVAEWRDRTEFARLCERVLTDEGTYAVSAALMHPEEMREASSLWFEANAAAAVAGTLDRKSHTPYTSIAKILRAAGLSGRQYNRGHATPLPWPTQDAIVPAVFVRIAAHTTRDAAVRALAAAGIHEVAGVSFNGRGPADRMLVVSKAPEIFVGNADLLAWVSRAAQEAAMSWRPRRSMTI